MNINVQVFGDEDVLRLFDGIDDRAADLQPAFRSLVGDIERTYGQAFGGTPDLVLTGALRDSLTGSGSGAVERITPTELFRGTSLEYAVFHHHRLLGPFRGKGTRWGRIIGQYIVDGELGVVGL